ncbi:MAG: hypothetical protein K1X89_10540 [Myxococcaceae bacterium]|nr:hypothetical protein [Myxococcaceae bacterium]
MDLHRLSITAGAIAAALVVGMLALFLATGVGQDALQWLKPPDVYAAALLADPGALRAGIGLDNAFIVFYALLFAAQGALLWRSGAPRVLVAGFLLFEGLTALLDLVENMHFLTMIAGAALGQFPSAGEIAAQVFESMLKFHLSYLGLAMLGFALPVKSRLGGAVAFALRWVQWPIGLAISAGPLAWAVPLVFARFSFFVFGLVAFAVLAARREFGSGAPA